MTDSRVSSPEGDACPMVGVIGGMGPDATVEFMQRVIDATPADDDSDHIHLLVDNNPKVPSRIKALIEGDGENPGPTIAAMAQRLEKAGARFLVMPCNTAHYYWEYAQESVGIPVFNMIRLTLEAVHQAAPGARVGMLASPALRKIGLYERYADDLGLKLVYPHNENALLEVIRAVKRGERRHGTTLEAFNRAAEDLGRQGADVLVLACTELSVIQESLTTAVPVYDSLQILADEVVRSVEG
ncbi:aspartate racemase [Modicisalibacter ilicicola DSM 19980]|uniref:Aspartate racemase n=1 Tax=Modicisalibacter ilicicola DSM 19980 TaxID=1121942 RepID=A0A1M4U940_9GAMM|nr:amino acid racemase [Halomonas ilicicola]SHE53302.1 aspartate racemase [Halomonas ilicicola DSM 19980]